MNEPCETCNRLKHRGDGEKTALIHRLSRIEGQVRGLRSMVERDAYCPDILTQAAAATSALQGFSRALLAEHIRTCVAEDVRQGRSEAIDELIDTLQKFMR